MSWKDRKKVNQYKREKVTRYSIRKYSFGAASVAVAIGFFGIGPVVQADSLSEQPVNELGGGQEQLDQASREEASSPQAEGIATNQASAYGAPAAEAPLTEAPSSVVEATDKSQPELESPVTSKEVASAQVEASQPETADQATPAPKEESSKPQSAAMPRPSRQGQALTTGTGFRAAPNKDLDVNGPGIEDASEQPKVEKPALTENRSPEDLQKQVSWLDFGDSKAWTGLSADGALQVGSTYTKELTPGYIVHLKVKSLKPFQATEVYKNRVAGSGYEGSYNPNAENHYLADSQASKDGESTVKLKAYKQNYWSKIKEEGFDTGERKTVIRPEKDGANAGVQFELSATYKGVKIKPTVVIADSEEASPGEFITYITNGGAWEHVGEWAKGKVTTPYVPQDPKQVFSEAGNGAALAGDKSLPWSYFTSKDQVTAGLGSQVFGPVVSRGNTVPLIMTHSASQLGVYITTSGQQAFMMGFLIADFGDAPASYGAASHAISKKDQHTGEKIQQPYLGDTEPDMDFEAEQAWTGDDQTTTADEGIDQLLPNDMKGQTNQIIKLDRHDDGSFSLKVKASASGTKQAYLRGWVDFNNNGRFDENEASDLVTVNGQGAYSLVFRQAPAMMDPSLDHLGARLRIAIDEDDILKPIGLAYTGEVEDFRVQMTYPPKGGRLETLGDKGQTQRGLLSFEAQGKSKYDYQTAAKIDENRAPQIVLANGQAAPLDKDGYYTVANEGKYKVTGQGKDVQVEFVPAANFEGQAQGISVRRFDSNGASTAWKDPQEQVAPISQQTGMMDAYYAPIVMAPQKITSSNLQGLEQVKDLDFVNANQKLEPSASNPATFVDSQGQVIKARTLAATKDGQQIGVYELEAETGRIHFKPTKDFVGQVDPISLLLRSPEGNAAKIIYQAEVIEVKPRGQEARSQGLQGQRQTGRPLFQAGASQVPLSQEPIQLKDPKTGQLVSELRVEGQGTYRVETDGEVSFSPEKNFIGQASGVTVVKTDVNGTPVEATYTPSVEAVKPSAENVTSSGKQGQVQTGTPVFKSGDDSVALSDQPAKLKDPASGELVENVTIPGQGSYQINDQGQITFTPEKTFTGQATGVTVVKTDVNGTPAEATYTPSVEAVKPSGENVTSTGKQGQVQTGTPVFKSGDDSV
ncbi:YSIRK signal domain/LPXTG anchor domain surface protein, partial [Streptococcus oricebi]